MTHAVVALGSNLGERRVTLDRAIAELGRLPTTRVIAVSRWIETEPVDAPPGSPAFLNGATLIDTGLPPLELLEQLLGIERAHGRTRGTPNAARTLDLDLVLHGTSVVDTDDLVLPHPRAHERAFVLGPAADVAPDMLHPVQGRTLRALCTALTEWQA